MTLTPTLCAELQLGQALIVHCESAPQRKQLHNMLDQHHPQLRHRSMRVSCVPPHTNAEVKLYGSCSCGQRNIRLDHCSEYEGQIHYVWGRCQSCGEDVVVSNQEYDQRYRTNNILVIQRSLPSDPTAATPIPLWTCPQLPCLQVPHVPRYKPDSRLWRHWLRAQLPDTWVDAKELVRRAAHTGLLPPLLNLVAQFVGNSEY